MIQDIRKWYKNKKNYVKDVDTYPSITKFIPEYYKTQEMWYRALHRCFFVFDSIADKFKTWRICNIAVFLYPSFVVYNIALTNL